MDETHSELTKISTLPKRLPIKVDKTYDLSSQMSDKSFTEISDVTDISISKLLKSNANYENAHNQLIESETVTDESHIQKRETEKSVLTLVVTIDKDEITSTSSKKLNVADDAVFQAEFPSVDDVTIPTIDKIESRFSMVIEENEELEEKPETVLYLSNQDSEHEPSNEKPQDYPEPFIDNTHDRSNILPVCFETSEAVSQFISEEGRENSEEILKTRTVLLAGIHTAIINRKSLTQINDQLQSKLADHFRRKRPDAALKMQRLLRQQDSGIVDIEQRYSKYIQTVLTLQTELIESENEIVTIKEKRTIDIVGKEKQIQEKVEELNSYRYHVAISAANSHTGKKISLSDWEAMLRADNKKAAIAQNSRLENIKLKNRVNKLRTTLVSKESIGNKLSIIDFEQIKLENQAFHEKLEDRKDMIYRLRTKIQQNIHIITHMKEKIDFSIKEIDRCKHNEVEITRTVNMARRGLTKLKKARDEVVVNNVKLYQSGGLMNDKMLLRHFEQITDEMVLQTVRIDQLNQAINSKTNSSRNTVSIY